MRPKFEYGESVRVIRNIRNDGTYPGKDTGKLLIRSGSVGFIRDVGTFLQDQLIYTVDFIESGVMVGCREQELQYKTERWVSTRFEFQEKVTPTRPLGLQGKVIANPGDEGEIEKVLRYYKAGPAYHVRFGERTLLVSESVLEFIHPENIEEC